jgi:hypothetical protein
MISEGPGDVLLVVNGYVRGASVDLTGGPRMPDPEVLRRHGLGVARPSGFATSGAMTMLQVSFSEPAVTHAGWAVPGRPPLRSPGVRPPR